MTVKPGCGMTLDDHLKRTQIYRDMLYKVQAQLQKNNASVMIVDTTPTLCDHETRRCDMVKEGRYLYDFTDHTSPFGSLLVGEVILKHMKGN